MRFAACSSPPLTSEIGLVRNVTRASTGAIPPPGSTRPWAGRAVTNARAWLAQHTAWPTPCPRCGADVHSNWWHLGHRLDRQAHPHLTWDRDNWQVEHPRCSTSAGASQGNKRRPFNAKANTNALMNAKRNARGVSMSPEREARRSLSFVSGSGRVVPVTLSDSPRSPGERDGLPRFFSEPHPEAVRSRGDEMVAFAEKRRGGPLRWFQWVCAQRRYEVRADGSWCWPLVFHSTSRQQGKSVDLAEDAAWYCAQCTAAELVLHSAHRVKTSLDVQAELWPWAEGQGLTVHRLLGDSRIVWPSGAVWATVATESAYGRRPKRLLSDESWAVAGVKFWNSLYPALGDFWNPQALFFSTANLEEQGLVSDLRKDPSVCRMEWGALEGEDQGDEGVWRASSAFWGPGRLSLMRTASTRPGFAEQWLNVWPGGDGAWRWLPGWATDAARGAVPWPAADVGVAGVESRWHPSQVGDAPARWAVAVAWVESGRVLARVERVDTLGQVVALVGDRRVHAHSSVVDQLAAVGRGWRCEAVNSTGQRSSAEVLAQLVRARGLTVDGVADETWAGVRVFPSDGGEVVDGRRSTVDVAGVKALGYAVAAASKAAHSGPVLVA